MIKIGLSEISEGARNFCKNVLTKAYSIDIIIECLATL